MNQPLPQKQLQTLERKHNARVAAVQAIFSQRVLEAPLNGDVAIKKITTQWESELDRSESDKEWNVEIMPQKALLESILLGVAEEIDLLEEDVNSILRDDWKLNRINPILTAILLAAAYELKCEPERKTEVVLSEYVTIADDYVEPNEVDFVNGAMNNLAKKYRDIAKAET